MANPNGTGPAAPPPPDPDPERRHFIATLAANGQLADVTPQTDTATLPPNITHVRYPDGTLRRIRFGG